MLTIKGAERAVEAAMAELDRRIQGIAERAREERVIPTCRRIGGSFSSGMGTFSFFDRHDRQIDDSDRRIASTVDLLNVEIYSGQYLGFWVADVEKA